MRRFAPLWLGVLATLLAGGGRTAVAQSCTLNYINECIVTGDATRSLFITITRNARLVAATGTLPLPTPSTTELQTTFGVPVSVPLTVRANSGWSVSISSTATVWSATPGSARQNKPVADLQWGLSAAGAFTGVTTGLVTVQSGSATGGASVPLHLRVSYNFALDRAGSYTIPVRITLTAP
ncbi:MAG: hypothetical protein KF709_13385 [Gemmatimonadaceae bacterium]|nr:hypothetical protein [Gemmatimonadaceae bacterium]